jgi:putative nucleotidyltransferase with HDIG domain
VSRILFVDDEAAILDGLRNVLRAERRRWSMSFALGGEAALEALAEAPFDVIVTDMRMPGMDGLTLLGAVRERHPRVARVVLSGHADLSVVAQASSVAHRYLLKPCEPVALRDVIERALRLQELLANDALRTAIGGLGTLPAAPSVVQALAAAFEDPEVEIRKLAAIVKRDVALSARVLHFANSAYCGFAQRIASIESAVLGLGLATLRHLALTVEVFRSFPGAGGDAFEQLERHALLTARIARRVAPQPHEAELVFAAGLLHDAGKLVLMSRAPDAFRRAGEEARRRGVPSHVTEREALGATHAEIGAYLLGMWDLPHAIVDAVAFHHALDRVGQNGFDTLSAVALADALAHGAKGDAAHEEGSAVVARLATYGDPARWRELALAEAGAAC